MSAGDKSSDFPNKQAIVGGGFTSPGVPKVGGRRSYRINNERSDSMRAHNVPIGATDDENVIPSTTLLKSDEDEVVSSQTDDSHSADSAETSSIVQTEDVINTEIENTEDVEEPINDDIVCPPSDTKSSNPNLINVISLLLPIMVPICVVLVGYVLLIDFSQSSTTTIDINEIKTEFPLQDDELWISFESGVKDVVTLNRPSTFILLYEEKSENTVKKLVPRLSKFAICNITGCDNKPITLTESELNSPKIVGDYGELIDKYRTELEQNGVMVVKNLEKIRGISAQAFHTFCDEFTPLVEKSLFIFTMKVDKLPGKNKMKFIEDDLKQRWSEVKIDTLVALITRITSMVLEIL